MIYTTFSCFSIFCSMIEHIFLNRFPLSCGKCRTVKYLEQTMESTLEGKGTSPTQVKLTALCLDSGLLLRTHRLPENVIFPGCWVPTAETMDFTIVPPNTDAAGVSLPFQAVFTVAALSALVFLQMGYLGVIFLRESLLHTRWSFIVGLIGVKV